MNLEIIKKYIDNFDNIYLFWNTIMPYLIYINENNYIDYYSKVENDLIEIDKLKNNNDKVISKFIEYLEKIYGNKAKKNFKKDEFEIFLKQRYIKEYLNNMFDKYFSKKNNIKTLLTNIIESNQNFVKFYNKRHYEIKKILLTTKEKLIIGFGNPNILEVGFSFHHLYGVPYIPGSELKGIVRSYYKEEKNLTDDSEEVSKIFGNNDMESSVLFIDAFLTDSNKSPFEIDIMNPHYVKYYNDKNPPADYLEPKPIFFIVLKENVSFETYIISKDEKKLKDVKEIMFKYFPNYGLGAKTTVGYGGLNVNEDKIFSNN